MGFNFLGFTKDPFLGDAGEIHTAATGKHRISAAFNKIHQETHSLEKELEQLDNTEASSSVCKDILHNVETRLDPLLPITTEPKPSWDRCFEGPQDKSVCKCCIM